MQNVVPDVFVKHSSFEQKPVIESFSSLFLSCEIDELDEVVVLNSLLDLQKFNFLLKDHQLIHSIKAYFENGGSRLYVLSLPNDLDDFDKFLSSRCDRLLDLESVAIVKLLSTSEDVQWQNVLSNYCKRSHRVSVCSVDSKCKVDELFETIVFYPNMLDKDGYVVPSFAYVTALFSYLARSENISLNIANIELKNCVELVGKPMDGVNLVVNENNQNIKLWGARVLNGDIRYISVLRVLYYIKRKILHIVKWSIFEPNSEMLKEKLTRQIKNFLFELYKKEALKGSSQDEAFLVVCDERNNSFKDYEAGRLNFDIAVSIAKPLEYIVVRLSRVQGDGTQATINLS